MFGHLVGSEKASEEGLHTFESFLIFSVTSLRCRTSRGICRFLVNYPCLTNKVGPHLVGDQVMSIFLNANKGTRTFQQVVFWTPAGGGGGARQRTLPHPAACNGSEDTT